jgi:ubiquinone/menaquinone biosynthesis C-methylase UbiE
MIGEKRFHGKLSTEYRLFKRARPQWDDLERQIGTAIARHRPADASGPLEVVEIGGGTGFTTAAILAARPGVRLSSVDNEGQMVAQARRNLRSWIRAGTVTVSQADALSHLTRRRTGSVDAVASMFTLHNFERGYRQRVLRQIYRVLKPGGVFVNADKYAQAARTQAKVLRDQLIRYFDVLVPIGRHDLFHEVVAHYMSDEDAAHVMKEAEAVRAMRRLGFRSIRRPFRRGMDAVYLAKK